MKPALLFLLLPLVASGPALPAARAASGQMERMEFAGHRYLRIGDWARFNNFDIHWLQRDEILQLTNRSFRVVFQKNSKDMQFNGVDVLLSYPVVVRDGAGYLAEADLKNTLTPLLSPLGNWNGARIKNIVIDPGHGGKDPGFQVGPYQEKKYALLLAQELCDQLKRVGFNTSLTRSTDTFIDLPSRPDIARRRGADLFISLHWNSVTAGRNDVKGVQTYCLTPAGTPSSNPSDDSTGAESKPGNRNNDKNLLLAYELQNALIQDLGADDHGVRRARYAVLRDADMPAVLIEGGYMSHPAESKRIYDAAYRQQMARAIVEGILAYKRMVEPPTPVSKKPASAKTTSSVTNSGPANSHSGTSH